MFCIRCGSKNGDVARFCTSCGTPIPELPNVMPPTVSPSEAPAEAQISAARKSAVWPYVVLGINLVLLVGGIGLTVFTVCFDAIAGTPDKLGQDIGKALVPIILFSSGVKSEYKWLLEREPHSDPRFKRRHLRLSILVGVVFVAVLCAAVSFGNVAGTRVAKAQRLDRIIKDLTDLKPKATAFRLRLRDIRNTPTPTMHDYLKQCSELDVALREGAPLIKRREEIVARMSNEIKDDPKLQAIFAPAQKFLVVDNEMYKVILDEVEQAKVLEKQPSNKQEAYYQEHIQPLEDELTRLGTEMSTVIEHQKLPVPQDVREALAPK